MAVKMRLRREGKKKQPYYRVVVADATSPRDGRFIEDIGYYQPLHEPSTISINHDRALYWLRNGVQPSEAVLNLLRIQGIWEEFKPGDPGRDRTAKHAAERQAREAREAKQRDEQQKAEAARAAANAAAVDAAREQAIVEDTQPDPGPPEDAAAIPGEPEDAAASPEAAAPEAETAAQAKDEGEGASA